MLSQTVAEKVSGLSETFGLALGRTETLLKNMESVLTSTHQQASTYRELTEELAGITRSFQATSGNLNDGQTQLKTVVDRFVSLNAALDQRLAHSERQTEKLGDVTEALREAAEQLGTEITRQSGTLAELGEKTDGFFKRVNDDTSRYYNGVSTALQDYLNKTQDSLSRACSMLGSTVEELQEPLEELVEALTAKAGA